MAKTKSQKVKILKDMIKGKMALEKAVKKGEIVLEGHRPNVALLMEKQVLQMELNNLQAGRPFKFPVSMSGLFE